MTWRTNLRQGSAGTSASPDLRPWNSPAAALSGIRVTCAPWRRVLRQRQHKILNPRTSAAAAAPSADAVTCVPWRKGLRQWALSHKPYNGTAAPSAVTFFPWRKGLRQRLAGAGAAGSGRADPESTTALDSATAGSRPSTLLVDALDSSIAPAPLRGAAPGPTPAAAGASASTAALRGGQTLVQLARLAATSPVY